MPLEICLFLWRGIRASGRTAEKGICRGANCASQQRHGANEAAVPGDAGGVCGWRARHFSWDADAGERPRLSAGDTGGSGVGRFVAELAGFSRSRTDVSVTDTGCGPCRAWRIAGTRADSVVLSRALRDSGCGAAGLCVVLRTGTAFSENDGVPALHVTGECDCEGYEPRECDQVVASAVRIFLAARWESRTDTGAGFGAAGAAQKGASVSIFAEIAEAVRADEIAERCAGVLRSE